VPLYWRWTPADLVPFCQAPGESDSGFNFVHPATVSSPA
jgi:hypothetical protein